MKQFLSKVVPGLLLVSLLGGSAWAQSQPRIGTIDLAKVFDNYYKKKQAEAMLKERAAEMEKGYKELVTGYEKDKGEYDKIIASAADSNISSEEREKRKKDAETLLKKLKQSEVDIGSYQRTAAGNLDAQKTRMIDKLVDEIREVVNTKARSAGFSMVIDTASLSAKGTPVVIFNDGKNDITDSTIAQLNVGAPLEPASVGEKKADGPTATNPMGADLLGGKANTKKKDDTKK